MTETNQLLHEYVDSSSESAFQEIVSRYVDLVHSVALRRLGGDPDRARDVVQMVFTDLARKAARLRRENSLGGWLHRHTCFVSSTFLRTERRRLAREREAVEMNLQNEPSEVLWQQLAPLLDEAIDQLGHADRQAIVLRFYERRALRAVGAALGTNEDAAQKRVSRALEKLRLLLAHRGVSLSVGALGTALVGQAVSAAPANLATLASSTALANVAGTTDILATIVALTASLKLKLLVGAVIISAISAIVISWQAVHDNAGEATNQSRSKVARAGPTDGTFPVLPASATGVDAPEKSNDTDPATDQLRLTIVSAENTAPLPGVRIIYRGWEGQRFLRNEFTSDQQGIADVFVPRTSITELELTTSLAGFADTRLDWRTDRGGTIPLAYTLHLIRATPIGGLVIDPEGRPVGGAKVGVDHGEDGSARSGPESHEFGGIETTTDAEGRWRIDRIASELLSRLYVRARHPEYVDTPTLRISDQPDAELQLRNGTHVSRLGRGISIRGFVLAPEGQPVTDAQVFAGGLNFSGRRETTSLSDGSFTLVGCPPGRNMLTAEAKGYVAATIEAEVNDGSDPVRIVLQNGKVLRLRVVNKSGQPIAGANVWYDHLRNLNLNSTQPKTPPAQIDFSPKTDLEGRVVWESAPEGELIFSFAAAGYMSLGDVKIRADDEEHLVTLSPALVVSGAVSDAATGESISKFRIACGWPSPTPDGSIRAQFSTIDRFWLDFAGGTFRHSIDEPAIMGMPNPGYILKFEAEGYAPVLSRVIKPDEVEVRLDIALEKASHTEVKVLLPSGRPAVGVDVGLAGPGAGLELRPGGFSRPPSVDSGVLTTDEQGRFRLPSDPIIQRAIAAGPAGYAEAAVSELKADPTLVLRPWGRIEGTFASGNRAADRSLILTPLNATSDSLRFDFQSFRVASDDQGQFVFPKAPPGRYNLVRLLPSKLGEMTSWLHVPLQEVEIRSGETTVVTVGGNGRTVTTRLRWPPDMERQPDMQVFGGINTPMPQPPPDTATDPDALARWFQSPAIRALASRMHSYPLVENSDGSWSAEEVLPGEYVLSIVVVRRTTTDTPGSPSARVETTVTIPADGGSAEIEIGELALQSSR